MYDSQELARRIKETVKKKSISIAVMCNDLEITTNLMHNMKTSVPKSDTIYNVAEYLGVSLDYLFGRTDVPDLKNNDDVQIFNVLQQLSPVNRAEILLLANEKLDKQKNTVTT